MASTLLNYLPSAPQVNFPLLAIPAYYVFSIAPHAYAVFLMKGAGYKFDNAHPRVSSTPEKHHDTYPPTSTSSSSKSKSSSSKKRSHSYDKLDHYPDSDLPSPSQLARSLPPWLASTIHRAESASKNNIESMPLFATAVLASLVAERVGAGAASAAASGGFLKSFTQAVGTTTESGRVDTGLRVFVAAWFALRAVYTVAYVKTESQKWSYLRSVVWAAGCGLVAWQTWKAAVLLG